MMTNNGWKLNETFLSFRIENTKKNHENFSHPLKSGFLLYTYFIVYQCVSVHVWIFSNVDIWMSEGWRPFCRLKLLNLAAFEWKNMKILSLPFTGISLNLWIRKGERTDKKLFVERLAWWHKEKKWENSFTFLYYVS